MSLYKKTVQGFRNLSKHYAEEVMNNRNFLNWFDDSVVKNDSNDIPYIVFHGTETSWIRSDNKFKEKPYSFGFHFGTNDSAFQRVSMIADETSESNIIPVYLRINNPLITPDMDDWMEMDEWETIFMDNEVTRPKFIKSDLYKIAQTPDAYSALEYLPLIKDLILDCGYDGIVYVNAHEDIGSESYIVFDNKQIKSIFNNGDFNPNTENIFK